MFLEKLSILVQNGTFWEEILFTLCGKKLSQHSCLWRKNYKYHVFIRMCFCEILGQSQHTSDNPLVSAPFSSLACFFVCTSTAVRCPKDLDIGT